jgi:hypothetical protein
MGPFAYILPPETDQIHCGAIGLALFRRPEVLVETLPHQPYQRSSQRMNARRR